MENLTENSALFDSKGRLQARGQERVYSRTDRGYFGLTQPQINYDTIYAQVSQHLGVDLRQRLSVADFKARAEKIRKELMAAPETAPLFQGIHVPFIVLNDTANPDFGGDLGKELDQKLLPAVNASFRAKFPQFEFKNIVQGALEKSMKLVPGTRGERILEVRSESSHRGVVVGWYFPNCLHGFAIPDQRSLIARLPERFALSGPIEAAYAFIGTPEILMKTDNQYPHLLALTSVEPVNPEESHFFWFFEAYGWNLNFNRRSMIGAVSEYYAGGLTVLG